ncbi:MAG: hypothetical protein FIB03_16365 [Anaerolineae bacterium]|nr:hypothetical protein [Anaerolineae bacterium]
MTKKILTVSKFFQMDELLQELQKMRYRTERVLTENIELRKVCQSKRHTKILKDLSENYKKIIDVRAEVEEQIHRTESFKIEWGSVLERLQRGEISEVAVSKYDSIRVLNSERRAYNKLDKAERDVGFSLDLAKRALE